jgi:hypothetical protein
MRLVHHLHLSSVLSHVCFPPCLFPKQVGNIALGYTISSSTVYPSMAITGQDRALAGDVLDVMNMNEAVVREGTGAQTGTAYRWGDYASMSIDPTDECTFFFVHEYIETEGDRSWKTFISSFRFPSCAVDPTAEQPTMTDDDFVSLSAVSAMMLTDPTATSEPTAVSGQFAEMDHLFGSFILFQNVL